MKRLSRKVYIVPFEQRIVPLSIYTLYFYVYLVFFLRMHTPIS